MADAAEDTTTYEYDDRGHLTRLRARNWACNHLTVTDEQGSAVSLLRRMADTVEQLGPIDMSPVPALWNRSIERSACRSTSP